MTVLDVVVVGGGQAGLALGYLLQAKGAAFAILDAGSSIGHVWRDRWDSLRLFTPARYSGLPGLPFPAPPDTYPTKDQVADYLQQYATAFDLPVRLGTRVTALRRCGDHFRLGAVAARSVVVATGPFQVPFVPEVAAGFGDGVTQVHSATYRNPEQLPPGPVLVVGGGNSGFQLAAELAATRTVHLSIGRRNACVPQRPLGRDIFWWQTVTGLISAPAGSWRGQWMRRGDGTVIGLSTRVLRRAGVGVRPRLTSACGDLAGFADGTTLPVSTVVWATGFRRDDSWIDVPDAFDDHGRLRDGHRGLHVLGRPWQRTAGSALLGFVGRDAARLAVRLQG